MVATIPPTQPERGHCFWRGLAKFLLALPFLALLLYFEEDWRGAHAWAVTRAKWEAKGESFDYTKFIPPLVPRDQNLAATPLFELKKETSPSRGSYLGLPYLEKALRDETSTIELPQTGAWQRGELTDMAKIQKTIFGDYKSAFNGQTPPADSLAQFDALFPFTGDLRTAAATRPFFRLDLDYAIRPPRLRLLGPIVAPIHLSQVLTLHAILALDHQQADLALGDIQTNVIVLSGVKRDPTLVGGLVAMGVMAISDGAIYFGLAHHDWSDAQLVELEQALQPINFLADYQFAMRSEVAQDAANLSFYKRATAAELRQKVFESTYAERALLPWPGGWWDNNMKQLADLHLEEVTTVDSQKRMVFPKAAARISDRVAQDSKRGTAYAPWNIWYTEAASGSLEAMAKFAQAQVWVDEMRIACALERHRLAHGAYPSSLDALVPAYLDTLPHDIMNGEPYHYLLRPDGTFLLYSVGWNQTDEGGKINGLSYDPKAPDYTQGDWVWPTPKL